MIFSVDSELEKDVPLVEIGLATYKLRCSLKFSLVYCIPLISTYLCEREKKDEKNCRIEQPVHYKADCSFMVTSFLSKLTQML